MTEQEPQTLEVPPPPQVRPPVQSPQCWVFPQPMLRSPQFLPWAAHVVGTQTPHTFDVPAPPQVSPATLQSPQCSVLPHPTFRSPQVFPCAAQLV